MAMEKMIAAAALAAALAAPGQQAAPQGGAGGRDAFLLQQAFEQVQRVAAQIDVLESNQTAIAERLGRLERGGGEIAALKADIEALKAENARLRRDMEAQRREIVNDIVAKVSKIQQQYRAAMPPPQADHRRPPRDDGPREEYTVQKGDTLSLIAQAFNTTVGRLMEMNSLKSDRLSIGQKIVVPGQDAKKGDRK